jgi:anti-sigma factor RsiW
MAMNKRQLDQRRDHQYVLERLSPYMDEQLSVQDRARVEAHLNACPSCRDELRTLQWTKDLLRQTPSVPLPRSFVIREADLAAKQTSSTRSASVRVARRAPAFALQWATALVAILLVFVVAGDLFLGRQFAAPGGRQEIALQSSEMPVVIATVVVESEVVVEAPVPRAAQEDVEIAAPVEAPESSAAPPTTDEAAKFGSTPEQAQVLQKSERVTDTTAAAPMMLQSVPISSTVEEAAPEAAPEKSVLSEDATPDQVAERAVEPSGETPLAMAPPAVAQEEAPLDRLATAAPSERGMRALSPALLTRAGWRVAEIGLGLLLVGLIVAVVWVRRRK